MHNSEIEALSQYAERLLIISNPNQLKNFMMLAMRVTKSDLNDET
jgi:hypothetical protein